MNNINSLLGLALRAGKLAVGEEPVLSILRLHKAPLLLIAADAAENSVRRAMRAGEEGNAVCLMLPMSKSELGEGLGRASCAVVAVTDAGFAASIAKRLAQSDPEQYGSAKEALEKKDARVRKRKAETVARRKAAAKKRK